MNYTVKFYGASDDLIEVDGDAPGCDEYSEDDATFLVAADKASAFVRVNYARNGCWQVAMRPVGNEGIPMPDASISLEGSYSASLIIEGVVHVVKVTDA